MPTLRSPIRSPFKRALRAPFDYSGGGTPIAPRNLLAEGDSITIGSVGTTLLTYANTYPAIASPGLSTFNNTAVSGSQISDVVSRRTADNALKSGTYLNVMSLDIGANDLNVFSAATFLTNFAAACDTIRADGWTLVLSTVLHRGSYPGTDPAFNSRVDTANATIRTWVGTHCDALVDWETTIMGITVNSFDTALFPDGLHPSALGHSYMLPAYSAVVNGISVGRVLPPAISIPPATYNSDQTVSLYCATSGAAIYYTLDGSTPSASSTLYSAPLTISASATLKVIAIKSGMSNSIVASCAIALQASTPAFSPVAGTYGGTQSVSITSTSGATIYYTTNGSTPTTGSTVYSGAISVAADTTIKALAVKTGYTDSAVGSAAYVITAPSLITSATGGTITTDGDYKVHTFTSNANFVVVTGSGNVQYLIVGGGGGGGDGIAGGGGAGDVLTGTDSLSTGTFAVVVGAGGANAANASSKGSNGAASTWNSHSAAGGGGAASFVAQTGLSGGSGGGASGYSTANNGGAGVGANVFAGGNNDGSSQGGGAGGGGASAVGANNSLKNGGAGGAGLASSITGASVTYAGGGGGGASGVNGGTAGAGGSGGGGAGSATSTIATAGTANTGGGGGGGGYDGAIGSGGDGGSGVVILRYQFQ